MLGTNHSNKPLTTRIKNPSVSRISGALKISSTGRTKAFRMPRSNAAPIKEESRVSDEAIRIRAYFISEQRERLAIPGDANSDWIEARRQLLAELGES